MTRRDRNHRSTPTWWTALAIAAAALATMVVIATPALARDSSYRRIVSELRSKFRATEQRVYGAGVLGGLAVAFIRPAGVSRVNFTILRDLDAFRDRDRDFNRAVRSAVESKWRPLLIYSAPARGEWTHIYSHPNDGQVELLIVNRARLEAVVAEVKIDPDKLSAFIDDPRILGIPIGSR